MLANPGELMKKMEKRGIVPGLATTEALMDELGHPEDSLRVVHFAGSNGKGSVIAFLSTILEEAGYKVGCYISPAIRCKEEQFQINGCFIDKEELSLYYDRVGEAAGRLEKAGKDIPTVFEAETALAFLYFKDQKVDYALVETGMGGLLDATNIVKAPALTVITSISYDHMAYLGQTLTEIAGQKAGIIKPEVPVVLAENPEEAAMVIRNRARQCDSELMEIRPDQYQVLSEEYDGSSFMWEGEHFRINLPGRHQVSNAVTALTAAKWLLKGALIKKDDKIQKDYLKKNYDKIQIDDRVKKDDRGLLMRIFRRGLYKTRWPGRLDILGREPLTFLDGAHNPDGARRLAEFLQKHFTNRRIIYIIGVLKDKEYEKMMAYLLPLSQLVYVFKPDNPRGLAADQLAACVRDLGKEAVVCHGVRDALEQARAQALKDDILVICGSLSFMGDLLKESE